MKKSELIKILKDVPDDAEIKLLTVATDDGLDPTDICDCAYDITTNEFHIIPEIISVPDEETGEYVSIKIKKMTDNAEFIDESEGYLS